MQNAKRFVIYIIICDCDNKQQNVHLCIRARFPTANIQIKLDQMNEQNERQTYDCKQIHLLSSVMSTCSRTKESHTEQQMHGAAMQS